MEVDERAAAPFAEHFEDSSTEIRLLKEIGPKVTKELSILAPNLLSLLRHDDPAVVRQSIITGTSLFSAVLTKMALQLVNSSQVEGWLEKLWSLMVQFKDAIFDMVMECGHIGSKVYAAKFLEICFLLFTSDGNDGRISEIEGKEGNFNVSLLLQGHPTLNLTMLTYEADRVLSLFLDILKSAQIYSGIFVITVINCLASIAKKRPGHYDSVLSALLGFNPNFESPVGCHTASIEYAVRISLIGLLRCIDSSSVEPKEKLLKTIRQRYGGKVTDHTIRQMEKLARGIELSYPDIRLNEDNPPPLPSSGDLTRLISLIEPDDSCAVSNEMFSKRRQLRAAASITQPIDVNDDSQVANNESVHSSSLNTSHVNSDMTPAEKMIVAIGALLEEGDNGDQSIGLLLSQIHPDLLADIVLETMKHLPKRPLSLSARNGSMPPSSQSSLSSVSSESGPTSSPVSGLSSALSSDNAVSGSMAISALVFDTLI